MTFTFNENIDIDGEYILFELNEDVSANENYGDQIGIQEIENVLWIHKDADLEEDGVINFIENYFTHVIKSYNFIRARL